LRNFRLEIKVPSINESAVAPSGAGAFIMNMLNSLIGLKANINILTGGRRITVGDAEQVEV
jgi:hypothetical protein